MLYYLRILWHVYGAIGISSNFLFMVYQFLENPQSSIPKKLQLKYSPEFCSIWTPVLTQHRVWDFALCEYIKWKLRLIKVTCSAYMSDSLLATTYSHSISCTYSTISLWYDLWSTTNLLETLQHAKFTSYSPFDRWNTRQLDNAKLIG